MRKRGPRAGKQDANHKTITDALDRLYIGWIDFSHMGCGVPDLLVYIGGNYHLWEIKNPTNSYGRRGLNRNQKMWAEKWRGGPVHIIRTLEDVERFISQHGHGITHTAELPKTIGTTPEEALCAVGL